MGNHQSHRQGPQNSTFQMPGSGWQFGVLAADRGLAPAGWHRSPARGLGTTTSVSLAMNLSRDTGNIILDGGSRGLNHFPEGRMGHTWFISCLFFMKLRPQK